MNTGLTMSLSVYNSNVTRNFHAVVRNEADQPVPNAELTLLDHDKVIWNGYSNSYGEADFNVTFTDANYMARMKLKALKENNLAMKNVQLLSNTTIVLNIHPPTVHNLDTGLVYFSIQDAIDANETLNGHTIFVGNGTYVENVVVHKSIKLMGENNASTIIDGGNAGSAISIVANNVEITGFTIENIAVKTDIKNVSSLVIIIITFHYSLLNVLEIIKEFIHCLSLTFYLI